MAMVRTLARYVHPDSDTIYSYECYCGDCGLHIDKINGSIHHVDQHATHWPIDVGKRDVQDISFCPWCGAKFDPRPWAEVEGFKPVDHRSGEPGTHRGDTHAFPVEPNQSHMLVTGCWCSPDVEVLDDGCVVRHKAYDPALDQTKIRP